MHDDFRRLPLCPLMSCCVTDVCHQGDSRFARSAQFENALNGGDFKDVMNVSIFPAPLLTSFQWLWARRSFYERSRIGEHTERNNGSLVKKSDINVLNVGKDCLEERDSVSTANRQWMWIDLGGCRCTNAHWAGPNSRICDPLPKTAHRDKSRPACGGWVGQVRG